MASEPDALGTSGASSSPWFGAKGIVFSRGEYPVLRNMEVAVSPGEIHALVGMHGSGKSTLALMLAGHLAPERGSVFAGGRRYDSLQPGLARELGIALVATPPAVFPRLTVLENLVMEKQGWWLGLSPRRTSEKLLRSWLDRNGIDLPLGKRIRDLPRDRWVAVEILARLFRSPRFLVLDGALEELTQEWKKRISAILTRMSAEGMSILIATQKIEEALSVADSLTVMRRGRAILTGKTGGMERLNLIRLCYDQLDDLDGSFSERESFHELMRYTSAMLNDLPTAVVVFDNNLETRFVNRRGQEIFPAVAGKISLEEIAGGRLFDFVRAACASGEGGSSVLSDSAEMRELHAFALRAGNANSLVDVRVQPLLENGARVGCMLIVEDVSLREDLRRRLMLSEKLASIGLLAAGVAHEVNNPLEIIGNYLNYLDEEGLAPDARKAVARMMGQVDRIHQIVNNLVAYSGGKAGSALHANPVELLNELIELLRFGVDFSRIDFRVECGSPVLLSVDPNELRQIFLNLIRNSLDAMPEGGEIAFSIDRPEHEQTARILVRDTGCGLRLENPNDIFLPFVTTKKGAGSHQGLGLYLVYGIVGKYGGSISVRNHPEGGCEFTVILPLADTEAECVRGVQFLRSGCNFIFNPHSRRAGVFSSCPRNPPAGGGLPCFPKTAHGVERELHRGLGMSTRVLMPRPARESGDSCGGEGNVDTERMRA